MRELFKALSELEANLIEQHGVSLIELIVDDEKYVYLFCNISG